jgi:hypothetical protein
MRVHLSARAASAALLLLAAAGIAGPASAGRGIQADFSGTPAIDSGFTCTLGQACAGYDLPISSSYFKTYSGPLGDVGYFRDFADPFVAPKIYFYKEGVIAFDDQLPLTASVSGGLASLGNGNWFAPGFGAATDMYAFEDPNGQFRVNWGPNNGALDFPGDPEGCQLQLGECNEPPTYIVPLFQLVISDEFTVQDEAFNSVPTIGFGYSTTTLQNRVSGYNYAPFTGGLPGPNPNDAATDFFDLRYGGSLNAGGTGAVPEPGVWAMMILGFGLAGAAMRRRRAAGPVLG